MRILFFGNQWLFWCHVLLLGVALALIPVTAALLGRACRKHGSTPPTFPRRLGHVIAAGFLAGIGGWACSCLGLLLLAVAKLFHEAWLIPAFSLAPVAALIISWLYLRKTCGDRAGTLPIKRVWLPAVCNTLAAMLVLVALMLMLARAREVGKRPRDAANLKSTGIALMMYESRFGRYPTDLRDLVRAGGIPADCLRVMGSDSPWGDENSVNYNGPVDWSYIPEALRNPKLVCAWGDPRFWHNEGCYVLRGDFSVRWLSPEELATELTKTRQWVREHPAIPSRPATTSMPSSTRSASE